MCLAFDTRIQWPKEIWRHRSDSYLLDIAIRYSLPRTKTKIEKLEFTLHLIFFATAVGLKFLGHTHDNNIDSCKHVRRHARDNFSFISLSLLQDDERKLQKA